MGHDTQPAVASDAAAQYLRLSTARGVGPISFNRLLARFGSIEGILQAGRSELESVDRIGPRVAAEIVRARTSSEHERELELAAAHGVRILCREDAAFPYGLRHIPDPPICLYLRGTLDPVDAIAVGIVGSRRCTHYGREQARRFGYGLAERGATIVSGLARGIDAAAHWGAIQAKGRTLAVLANGLADIYPPEHKELADRIADGHGAVLTELPMETSPDRGNFIPRNRIIAGLSLGVLVVEAAQRSGALATARQTIDYNREVFAIPGRIDSAFSTGPNDLIRTQQAKLVCTIKDVFDELGEVGATLAGEAAAPTPPAPLTKMTPEEQQLYNALDGEPRSVERLCDRTGLATERVMATLMTLQLKHLVRQLPGQVFVRAMREGS
ncbi:MAG: DNA-processing protein DprA [Phycisphaerae bacterium]|nr:DNA-processing protein DprA [Phycisphaerae bacterium]